MDSKTAEIIEKPKALEELFDEVGECRLCAVDTEADSLHRYRESLCLIQFAWEGRSVLIDPLALDDLGRFRDYVGKASIWMHGADYDMTMLLREFGVLPVEVFDTQIGARLLGVRKFGLGNLVEHYFGIQLSKSSQKADWGKRPLPPKMVDYALNDVRYLLPMAEKIVAGLKEEDRYDWFIESCEFAKAKVLDRPGERDDPWRIQGSGKLNRRGLNVLEHLWKWRDAEAGAWDRPSFMVATNRQLLEWSAAIADGGKPNFPDHFRRERRKRLDQALAEEKKVAESEYPEKVRTRRRRRDPGFEKKVDELLSRRNRIAAELDLEPSIIGSRTMIEALVDDEDAARSQWMGWQLGCLGLA